jgi:prepilin-type N-terminal cleavage/methylation domain-containing protein
MRLHQNNVDPKWSPSGSRAGRAGVTCRAFTLIEMLMVLIIIVIIAALALPHIRGNQESVAINAACRQLVDDLSFARQRAMSIRGTVAVVFISRDVLEKTIFDWESPTYTAKEAEAIKRLQGGVYTHYALYQYRTVGEQPGSFDSAHYITEWKSLPEKTFLDPANFNGAPPNYNGAFFQNSAKFPFPFSTSGRTDKLPYLAFDWEGRCIYVARDETGAGQPNPPPGDIRVARGSILYSRDPMKGFVNDTTFDVQQIPPYNSTNNTIHIDFLTGRAKRIELQLQ